MLVPAGATVHWSRPLALPGSPHPPATLGGRGAAWQHRGVDDHPDDATPRLHLPLRHVRAGDLHDGTAQSAGMHRLEALSGATVGSAALWMGRTDVAPSTRSADHHHGASETAIYVASGHPVFVFAEAGAEVRLETAPGDFVFVPPFTPHREENPSHDEVAVVVIARSTQEAIVVNLSGLDSAG